MLTDAHCHPFDLACRFSQAEEERRKLGVVTLASACDMEEFEYIEKLAHEARAENAARLLPCFAVHPQMGKREPCSNVYPSNSKQGLQTKNHSLLLDALNQLASENRLFAVGECGFDLYNDAFRATEKWQDEVFNRHLETALNYGLPLVLHVRRAMHKIFELTFKLKKCKAVIFHSWPGTLEEGQSLLRRGINAYFSFGNAVVNGRKQSVQSCKKLPADRLLSETDSPYLPPKGGVFSSWKDLRKILEVIAELRGITVLDLENIIEKNFKIIFNH